MTRLRPLAALMWPVRLAPAADIGTAGRLEWIALSELFIDPAYQRDILDTGKANIRRMIEHFSWALFGALVIAERGDGRYAIIDGQHRATAAVTHGAIERVPCLVLAGGVQAEARAFAAINSNVTRIHALQAFRAAVAAGEPEAVALTALCARARVALAPYPKGTLAPGETSALATLKVGVRRHGEKTVVAALTLLRDLAPDDGLPANAIRGAVELVAEHPGFALRASPGSPGVGGMAALMARAEKRRRTAGGYAWKNFADVLHASLRAPPTTAVPLARLMAGR